MSGGCLFRYEDLCLTKNLAWLYNYESNELYQLPHMNQKRMKHLCGIIPKHSKTNVICTKKREINLIAVT